MNKEILLVAGITAIFLVLGVVLGHYIGYGNCKSEFQEERILLDMEWKAVDKQYEKDYDEIKLYWDEFFDRCDTYKMCNVSVDEIDEGFGLDGYVNYEAGFYCVRFDGREMEDIAKSDYHEYCHYLVMEDYGHFCLGETEK